MEPTRMIKHPMSAVQPMFAHSTWQKERLTHSQLREQPRHRKETQQSWMKHNIASENLDSMPIFHDGRRTHNLNKKKKQRVGGTSRHEPCATSLSIRWQLSEGNRNLPTCAMGTESKFHLSGCETIDDTFAGDATQTAALNQRAAGNSG